jgi:DNA mismatch repair ATPase MutS
MVQSQNDEKVYFSGKVVFEVSRKEVHNEKKNEWMPILEIKVNDNRYTTDELKTFREVLESLNKKIDVLGYISDNTYDAVANEILYDIGIILYKLLRKDPY